MPEKRTKIPFPTPQSPLADGHEVPIVQSTERWSEVTLEDGTVLRVKPNVISAVRIDNQYDQDGNPAYLIRASQVMAVASAPASLRRGAPPDKVQ